MLLAGGGKTSCYESLRLAQTQLVQAKHAAYSTNDHRLAAATVGSTSLPDDQHALDQEPRQFQIHAHVLNPKSISLSELYGSYSTVTHDWSDGLASSLVRTAVMDQSQDMHWVVFDGPVDPVWVENMNTGASLQSKLVACSSGSLHCSRPLSAARKTRLCDLSSCMNSWPSRTTPMLLFLPLCSAG